MTPIRWQLPSLGACTVAAALAGLAACGTPAPTTPRSLSMSQGTCQQPPYPAEARRDQAEGTTELEFEVNALGRVTRVAIVKSSGDTAGHKVLDALALETINKCSFPPAPGFLAASSKVAYVWRLKD
jgi:periplasmic protein TonB